MHKNQEFHESYFQHTCLIIPEKDVLDTDIEGTGCITNLRRWWNDLFLLSYTTDRSRGFYSSSHAMRIERFRQFRKYRNRIHPMSKFRCYWDCLILHVLVMNKVIFRFTSTFIFDNLPMILFYFGALLELIIIADLYVNIKTGYINSKAKRVILDTKQSLINFCRKKLFIHFAAAIPLHWFMFLKYGLNIDCGLCKTNRFTCALKFISIFSLFRVYETSDFWIRVSPRTSKMHFFRFIRIAVLGFITMCQFYDLSDTLSVLVFIREGYVDQTSVMGVRAGLKYSAIHSQPSNMFVYYEISRTLKGLLLFPFGYSLKFYYIDKITSMVAYIIAYVFYAWFLLECYALVSFIMYPKDNLVKIKRSALNFLACTQLPDKFKAKVEMYFDFKCTRIKLTEKKNGLFRTLPQVLKNEIKLTCYMKLLMRIPLFCEWPLPVIEDLVLMLRKEVYLSNDIVALAWVEGSGLKIIDDGVLAVYSQHHKEVGHLIDGDYFGELSLVTDKEICKSYVVAITNCTILSLGKMAFRKFMKQYPDLFIDFKLKIKKNRGADKIFEQSEITSMSTKDSASILDNTFSEKRMR